MWQITPVAGIYALLISPIVHRLIVCYARHVDCTPCISHHVQQIVWFSLSAFFFTAEFPQSLLSPGRCDHFFHGHQVTMLYCSQLKALCPLAAYVDLFRSTMNTLHRHSQVSKDRSAKVGVYLEKRRGGGS